jgi:hypothetical protein
MKEEEVLFDAQAQWLCCNRDYYENDSNSNNECAANRERR